MSTTPLFRAGGLASGLDTTTLINGLVEVESRPLTLFANQQKAFQTKISTLGTVASQLNALKSAAEAISKQGVVGAKLGSTHTSFSVSAGSGAFPGRSSVQVQQLAQAAKARSAGFGTSVSAVKEGTLDLSINGTTHTVNIAATDTITKVAEKINNLGAPIGASVISDGTQFYLSLSNLETGHTVGSAPSTALQITENYTGAGGAELNLAITQTAQNSRTLVDGLTIERKSNELTDVIPGLSFSLKSVGAAEDVVVNRDITATQSNLQQFVSAFNIVIQTIKRETTNTPGTDTTSAFAGDSGMNVLLSQMRGLLTKEVPGLTGIRNLVDIGVESDREGNVTINASKLEKAINTNATAIDTMFSQATTGVAAFVGKFVKSYTDTSTGLIKVQKDGLQTRIDLLERRKEQTQTKLDALRERLVKQFTAMEKVVSKLKNAGDFLTQQANQAANNK